MFRFAFLFSLFVLSALRAVAAPSPTATPAASTTPTATPSPSPSPTTEAVINAMGSADLQQAIQLLKSNYVKPDALGDTQMERATLSGLVEQIWPGAMILPERPSVPNESTNPFFGELIEGHIGYLRPGALTLPNLQALDRELQNMLAKKANAVLLDLRASPGTNDFATAAEFAKRFVAKGKPLFTLRRAGGKQERAFTNERDPAFAGLMIVLIDGETAGPAEAIAAALRLHNRVMVIGQPSAGQAVEFADLPLNGGRVLRVAVAEAVAPDGQSLYPGGVKPDLPVELSLAEKNAVFAQSMEKGMAPFVFEAERPHMNEAALLAGRNPEIDSAEAAQRRRGQPADKPPVRDLVLQRALDVITSLAIYEQR